MQTDDTQMYTAEEVAEIMKVNIRTVRAWVLSGELPRVWIGKREYRISGSDLKAFIEKRKGQHPPDDKF